MKTMSRSDENSVEKYDEALISKVKRLHAEMAYLKKYNKLVQVKENSKPKRELK